MMSSIFSKTDMRWGGFYVEGVKNNNYISDLYNQMNYIFPFTKIEMMEENQGEAVILHSVC